MTHDEAYSRLTYRMLEAKIGDITRRARHEFLFELNSEETRRQIQETASRYLDELIAHGDITRYVVAVHPTQNHDDVTFEVDVTYTTRKGQT